MRYIPSLLLALLFGSVLTHAQTITTEPLAESAYCIGETVTVDYTLSGAVNPGNAFILQLSNPEGSFDEGFRNVGSISSTQSGSISWDVQSDIDPGDRYRFRVIASNPKVDGSDNGSDVALDRPVQVSFSVSEGTLGMIGREGRDGVVYYAFVDEPITLTAGPKVLQYFWWNLGIGVGASIEQTDGRTVQVSYSTPGEKRVYLFGYSAEARCESQRSFTINVVPRQPVIPADAHIVQTTEIFGNGANPLPSSIWVCPGGVCRIEDHYNETVTIFVEAGGSVESKSLLLRNLVVYLRDGASLGPCDYLEGVVVRDPGASVIVDSPEEFGTRINDVAGLAFDYSAVPANGCPSLAPYTVQIREDSRSIHTAEQENGSDMEYWVHEGGVLQSSGNHNVYYIEAGGRLVVNGMGNTIYVKDGGTVEVEQGSGHRIFYEMDAKIVAAGDEAVLLPSSGITFVSRTSSVQVPGAGASADQYVQISPNPFRSATEVHVDPVMGGITRIEIYDNLGRKVCEKIGSGEESRIRLEMSGYPAGVYHARVLCRGGEQIGRLVLE